jgi:hypothetical protein
MDDSLVKKVLIAMTNADQAMRKAVIDNSAQWDYSLDKKHTKKLKQIIAEYGWPTIPRVGVEASNDAWLIVQHADHDRVFQKECLRILRRLPKSDISMHNIAYLEDRLLVAEQKPQVYGTQFQGTGKDLKPQPIRDEAHVDQRRKAVGLNSIVEYSKTMSDMYGEG